MFLQSQTDQQWQEVQAMDRGDRVRAFDGRTVAVEWLDWATIYRGAAYNLTVDDIHTYYVLAGQTPVLVHNTNGCPRFEVDGDGNIVDLTSGTTRVGVPTLQGGTIQQVGGRIWGSGNPEHMIGTRTPQQLRDLASRGDAEKLQDFYRSAQLDGKGGATARNRVTLLQEIIDAWS